KGEHNVDFHPMVDFIEASPLRIETTKEGTKILATVDGIVRTVSESSLRRNLKLRDEEGISSLPDAKLFENLTLMGYNISPNQKFTFQKVPFHTRKLFTTLRVNSPSFSGRIVPLFDTMLVQQGEGSGTPTEPHHTPSPEAPSPSHTTHTSPSLPPVTTTSIITVTPTETTPIRATIAKSSTLPHDSVPRVTSPIAVEGKEREGLAARSSGDDAPLNGRSMDEGEAATERISDDSEEMATVLTSMDAATVLASRVIDVPTGSGSIPTISTPAEGSVPTGSEEVPTASPVFTTATVIDAQVARELEEQLEREDQRRAKQIARDAKVARIHVEEELQSMIDGLDSNNETIAKYLQEYHQFSSELLIERRVELISDLKTSKEVTKEAKPPEEVTEEKVKEMMQLVPIEEVYVEALQVKNPIIDWKHLDKEDLNQLWRLVKETLSNSPPTIDWKLYDSCGVHHVTSKDKQIFMLVEKDYPLSWSIKFKGGLLGIKCTMHFHCQLQSSHWQNNFPLLVKKDATAKRKVKPLPGRLHWWTQEQMPSCSLGQAGGGGGSSTCDDLEAPGDPKVLDGPAGGGRGGARQCDHGS
nr:hypothetical protein [Tanacetum cinerariifolium]